MVKTFPIDSFPTFVIPIAYFYRFQFDRIVSNRNSPIGSQREPLICPMILIEIRGIIRTYVHVACRRVNKGNF